MTAGTPDPIRTVIVGVGNCASSLIQSIAYCREYGDDAIGVSFPRLGGYVPGDIELVGGFDVNSRKVGKTLGEAAFATPNCTEVFHKDVSSINAQVLRGPNLDGVSRHMLNMPENRSFRLSDQAEPSLEDVVKQLQDLQAEVIIIFLPVGSQDACEFWAEAALKAGCAVVNGIPVFIASTQKWASRFEEAGLPILGDDFKAQFGATIVHRTLVDLAKKRGVHVDRTYQLNVGGNTDFLNMANHDRLISKRESKTEAVQAALADRLETDDIRVGPSDYVPWLNDRKVAYIRLEGQLLGGARTNIELRLDVEDSPNAAAEALTAIRCARIARDKGMSGAIDAASAFLFKHPPVQMEDNQAHDGLWAFAGGEDGQS
jgi:myo-inositol-1-phosphate synthase